MTLDQFIPFLPWLAGAVYLIGAGVVFWLTLKEGIDEERKKLPSDRWHPLSLLVISCVVGLAWPLLVPLWLSTEGAERLNARLARRWWPS